MPQPQDGVLITRDSAARLADMLRAYGSGQISGQWRPDRDDFGFGRTTSIVQTVQITGAAISTGYYPGKTKNWDNTAQAWVDGPACRVREVSGGSLVNGQIYSGAKLVGQDTVSSVDYLVFQVGGGSATGLTLGYYNGGNVLSGGGSPYTYITLADGSSMRIGGTPWGEDLYAAWHNPNGFATGYWPGLYQGAWGVILNDTNDRTYNYSIIPFTVVVEAKYGGNFEMVTDFVRCRSRYVSRSASHNFTALDPLKLVPTSGWYAVTLISKKGYVWTTGYGWEVIACRQADLSGSPTIPLIPGPVLGTGLGTF